MSEIEKKIERARERFVERMTREPNPSTGKPRTEGEARKRAVEIANEVDRKMRREGGEK